MSLKVLKFGGTSQSTLTYKMILDIINNDSDNSQYIIVLSAIKGITNKLIKFINTNNYDIWNDIIQINSKFSIDTINYVHQFILSVQNKKWNILDDINNFNDDKIEIVSIGEFFTTQILNSFLNHNNIKSTWISSFDIIKSNMTNTHLYNKGEFSVDSSNILSKFQNHKVIIIPGFSGLSFDNKPCLLGRGGSDTTGSIIASALNASIYEIWTDVDGIYSSDPRKISNAFIIPQINYNTAQEIAAMGAKVIHPYSILPCAQKNIPIVIKNTFNPKSILNTSINSHIDNNNIYAITTQDNVSVFKITSLNMWNNYGFVFDIFSIFKKYNIDVNIINTSQFNITTTTDNTNIFNLELVKKELSEKYSVELSFNNTIVSIIGDNIRTSSCICKIFDISKKYDIITTSYSSNDMTLSFVLNTYTAYKLTQELHNQIFPNIEFNQTNKWWSNYIPELSHIKEPTYVYSLNNITQQINKIKKLTSIDKFYYALKANNNPDIINHIITNDFGIECVSIEEIKFIISNFPKVSLLFTPNFCSINDYIEVIQLKKIYDIKIIIDNPLLIIKYGSIFLNTSIGIRLDLNIGDGHSDKVITQGKDTKFGMTINDLEKLKPYIGLYNITIEGLHSHAGSGIIDIQKYISIFSHLTLLVSLYPIKWIDIGGGFGISQELDFDTLNYQLSLIKPYNIQLFIEPGRYIVAKSGIIVGNVTQTKIKNNINYIGINIGMNNLIRPALYNSIHPIFFPLSKKYKNKIFKIVGPICESSDVFFHQLSLSLNISDGDIVIIDETGAYGEVMSSEYNMKPKCKVIIIDKKLEKNI